MTKKLLTSKKFWILAIIPLAFLNFKVVDMFQPGLDNIVAIDPFMNGKLPSEQAEGEGDIFLQEIHTQIAWESPQIAIPFPGTNKLLIAEMDGRIYTVEDNDNASTRTLVMDIQDRCWYYGWANNVNNKHGGFQNAIFHPDFDKGVNKDYIYVYYTHHPSGSDAVTGSGAKYYDRLSRFSWTGNSFDPDSELIMIQQYDQAAGHDGSGLVFDNDGFLYVSVGDEGNGSYLANTQKLNDRFRNGVWKIDVDMRGGNISHPIERQPSNANVPNGSAPSFTQGYYIPNDNPWATGTGEFLEEFYAIGLRQPFRMSYDAPTGDIWIGDVGSNLREEVNILDKPGLNFQWAFAEGFGGGKVNRSAYATIYGEERIPILDYPEATGSAVIGGYVYRGSAIPSLVGKYIFADNVKGNVFSLTRSGANSYSSFETIGNVGGAVFNGISSVGITHDDELLILKLSAGGTKGQGKIFKLTTSTATSGGNLPALLSETGVFSDMQNLIPSDGIIPYNTNAPLWSSGTAKQRWVSIPQDGLVNSNNERIGYSEEGPWELPVGTVFIKQFDNPNGTKMETRLWIHGQDGKWFGSSYRWRANGLEADLILGGASENVTINGENLQYEYPASNDCIQCHNETAGWVLGFNTRQLNGDILYPTTGRTSNQLETLSALGFIPQVDTDNVLTSVHISDNSESLEIRARSYFDANCAYCHLPGNTRADFDLRLSTPLAQQELINGAIIESLGVDSSVAISPGNVSHSMIYQRLNTADTDIMMPPLAKSNVDTEAVQLIAAWINSLAADCEPEDALVLGNTGFTDGNFIDGHSPHVNINTTDSYTNTTNNPVSICINDFSFYARRVGNPVTPFIAKVNGANDLVVISIGQTRLANEYQTGTNTFNYSNHSSDAVVLQPGETIAPGYIDAYPDGTGSSAGNSLIPAITTGSNLDKVWQSFKNKPTTFPAIVMGRLPEGNAIAPNLARNYQFNIGISTSDVPPIGNPTDNSDNIAYLKTATQSTTDFGGVASRAVDGTIDGVFKNNSVTHTEAGAGTKWWRVDLEETYDISDITIFNRTDCCVNRLNGAVVMVGDTDSTNPADYTQVNSITATAEQKFNNLNVTGRYVMVYKEGTTTALSLTEVQVFGELATTDNPTNNLALLKPAVQSSNFKNGGGAELAVDGNTDGLWTSGSVSHTQDNGGTTNPWWRVDLEATYDISDINIFNRTDNSLGDRLNGAIVMVGNTNSTNPTDYTQVASLTANTQQKFSNLNVTGRYVMVYLPGNNKILSLAEAQVFGEEETTVEDNIAFQKPTSQSTNYRNGSHGASSLGVDGTTNGAWANGSVTHTQRGGSTNPWWRVDLGNNYVIDKINVFNRTDCCIDRLNGAEVLIGTTDSNNPNDYVSFGTLTAAAEQNFTSQAVVGRYVMLYLSGTNKILSLAEVQVFGKATDEIPNGDTVVTLYTNKFFGANSAALAIGNYPNISLEGIPLNDVTSVSVDNGFTVELYPELNFGGTPFVLTADAEDLVALSFDDDTESVRVFSNGIGGNTDDCECASGRSSILVNGSFEDTSNPAYDSVFDMIQAIGKNNAAGRFLDRHTDADFPGWFTTGGIALQQGGFSNGGTIEVGQDGFLGFEAPDGRVLAEMDGNHHNQIVSVNSGQLLDWELSHRGREGVDVITVSVGPVGNQNVIATLSSGTNAWVRHTGQYQVPKGVTQIQFTITPLAASNGDIDSSNMLDFVKLCPANQQAQVNSEVATTMTIFPNPVEDVLTLSTETLIQSNALVQIYSSTGNLVKEEEVVFSSQAEGSLYVGDLNAGLYTVQILNTITGELSNARVIKR